ncbi:MAG: GldG family protein, partial [Oscillospiraceae bacterium]|nr:GldG family protein [Oscillospiraceae bacterium]
MKKENNTPEENEVKETETVENAAEKSVEPEKKKKRQREKKPLNKRKLKHGALSAALTVTVIAAVVVLNVIVGMVSDRVNTSADLTTAGIYSLDEQTKKYLDNTLNRDVTITVLNSQKSFDAQDSSYKQVSEILGKMQMESSHIKVDYLNIDQNPNYTSKFKGETLSTNYIVVECEETGRHKIISPYDYFNFNQSYLQYYGTYVVESSNIEQETVSAMMYTTSEKLVRIAFTDGYGEEDSTAFQNVLSKNG